MIHSKRVLALIPARGGSKRLSWKNILPISGKPLVRLAEESARASQYIDSIVCSSDSDSILSLMDCVKLRRPSELATDEASSVDVALHALLNYPTYDYLVLLQPTSPFRTAEHIDACIRLAWKFGSCVSERDGAPNGAVYAISIPLLKEEKQFLRGPGYEMTEWDSLDIDTAEDYERAKRQAADIEFSSVQ